MKDMRSVPLPRRDCNRRSSLDLLRLMAKADETQRSISEAFVGDPATDERRLAASVLAVRRFE
jgi:hypothetical protein